MIDYSVALDTLKDRVDLEELLTSAGVDLFLRGIINALELHWLDHEFLLDIEVTLIPEDLVIIIAVIILITSATPLVLPTHFPVIRDIFKEALRRTPVRHFRQIVRVAVCIAVARVHYIIRIIQEIA